MTRISQTTGEFSDRAEELRYRESCWGEWSARYRTASVVGAVFYVLGFGIDFISVEKKDTLPILLGLRCLFAVICVAEGFGLKASSYRPSLDYVVLLVLIACSVFTDVIIALSPGGIGQHTLTVVALLLIFYAFIPNRISFTVTGALFASASFIATGLVFFEPSRNEIASAMLYLCLANVLGVVVATATQRLGRLQYKGIGGRTRYQQPSSGRNKDQEAGAERGGRGRQKIQAPCGAFSRRHRGASGRKGAVRQSGRLGPDRRRKGRGCLVCGCHGVRSPRLQGKDGGKDRVAQKRRRKGAAGRYPIGQIRRPGHRLRRGQRMDHIRRTPGDTKHFSRHHGKKAPGEGTEKTGRNRFSDRRFQSPQIHGSRRQGI